MIPVDTLTSYMDRADVLEVPSQGHALLHVVEELCQHLGQAELTRDVLQARDLFF